MPTSAGPWKKQESSRKTSAAAADKSLQSCPTLCDPIDGSPPGSSVPGILTIYEQFADKEELLLETFKMHNSWIRKEAKERIRKAEHVLDIILSIYSLYFESLKRVNIKFFKDLERYPNIRKLHTEKNHANDKKFIAWVEMGRKQGLFREDANFDVLIFILRRDLETIFTANLKNEENELSKYTPDELGRALILFYLRGISTIKGQEIIEEYLNNSQKRE